MTTTLLFDPLLDPARWFDASAAAAGWFADDLMIQAAATNVVRSSGVGGGGMSARAKANRTTLARIQAEDDEVIEIAVALVVTGALDPWLH